MKKSELLLLNQKIDLLLRLQLENLKEKSSISIVNYYNEYEDLEKQSEKLGWK